MVTIDQTAARFAATFTTVSIRPGENHIAGPRRETNDGPGKCGLLSDITDDHRDAGRISRRCSDTV